MGQALRPKDGDTPLSKFVRLKADFTAPLKNEKARLFKEAVAAGYQIDETQLANAYNNAKCLWNIENKRIEYRSKHQTVSSPRPVFSVQIVDDRERRLRLILKTAEGLRSALLKTRELGSYLLSYLEEVGDNRLDWVMDLIENNRHLRQRITELEARVKELEGKKQ